MPDPTKSYLEAALKSGSEFVVVKEGKLTTKAISHHRTYEDARRARKEDQSIFMIREWLNFFK